MDGIVSMRTGGRTGGRTGSGVEPALHPSAALVAQRGQVAIEYLLLTVFVVMVLVSDEGQGSLHQLLDAIQSYYARFTYGISLP